MLVTAAGRQAGARTEGEEPVTVSSCSWRVRIALSLKGIDYEYRSVDIRHGQQSTPDYFRLNPSRKVPTLLIDGHTLSQSRAIMEYLEETRPSPPLLPSEASDRARVRALCDLITADIQPLQNSSVLSKLRTDVAKDYATRTWPQHWIQYGFTGLEQQLSPISGSRCIGDTTTLLDVCLVPQVRNAHRYGLDMSAFPTLSRLYNELLKDPHFHNSRPEAQPDHIQT